MHRVYVLVFVVLAFGGASSQARAKQTHESLRWNLKETTGTILTRIENPTASPGFRYEQSDKISTSPLIEKSHITFFAPVKPGQQYIASFQYLSPVASPMVRVANKGGSPRIIDRNFPPGIDWQSAEVSFVPSEEETQFRLWPAGEYPEATTATAEFKNFVLREAGPDDIRALKTTKFVINPDKVVRLVDRRFFGANTLFWVEDDAALAQPELAKAIRDMKCTLLRFPGGEVADNYHWKSQKLDDPKYWPAQQGPDKTDTDEFMAWCRELGCEPIFVVNLDSSYLAGNPEEGIREAAEWVRYCNIEKSYGVKHWEIGNETYLKVTRYPMRAREYAKAVREFSAAMKTVDPTIQIGAVGPVYPDEVVPFDQILPELVDKARAPGKKAARLAAVDKALEQGVNESGDAWWPTLCDIAGNDFDFAVVHQYQSDLDYHNFSVAASNIAERVETLTDFFKHQIQREMPIALTEWNLSPDARVTENEQAIMVADLAMGYLAGGVSMANFWPLRGKKPPLEVKNSDYRPLLTATPFTRRPSYHMMRELATHIADKMVAVESVEPGFTALATKSAEEELTLFLLNKQKSTDSGNAVIAITKDKFIVETANALAVTDSNTSGPVRTEVLVVKDQSGYKLKVPPMSLTTLKLRHER